MKIPILIFMFLCVPLKAQTFKVGKYWAPYNTYYIGTEFTLTNSELMTDPASDRMAQDSYDSYQGKQVPIYNIEDLPTHLKYLERIFSLHFSSKSFTTEFLTRDARKKITLEFSLKQFRGAPSWVKYMVDPHVIETIFPPDFLERSILYFYWYDVLVFKTGQRVGLRPDRNWGQAHVNVDVLKAVRVNPLVYRNFVVGQIQSWPFWNLIGVDIQSAVWDWTNQRKALEAVQKFFFEVLDPWIVKWAKDPRRLTDEEMIGISRYFDKPIAPFRNKSILRRFVKSNLSMKQQMGLDIINSAHMALRSWWRQYNAKLKSSFHLGFRIRRGRPVFEFRRVPALYDVMESIDWSLLIISQFEDVVHLNGLLNFQPMPSLTYPEQMKYFNTRLLSLGFNPEDFRIFLNPQFKSLRYFVDPCVQHLSVFPSPRLKMGPTNGT